MNKKLPNNSGGTHVQRFALLSEEQHNHKLARVAAQLRVEAVEHGLVVLQFWSADKGRSVVKGGPVVRNGRSLGVVGRSLWVADR